VKEQAVEKLKKELADVTLTKGNRYVEAVKKPTVEALIGFCRQDEEIAQAVVQQEKTLADCLKSVMSGCGSSISDVEVYRRAVQFYFPGADVRVEMTVDLCASVSGDEKPAATAKKGIVLNLSDYL
jgi:hypothetical protein